MMIVAPPFNSQIYAKIGTSIPDFTPNLEISPLFRKIDKI